MFYFKGKPPQNCVTIPQQNTEENDCVKIRTRMKKIEGKKDGKSCFLDNHLLNKVKSNK